MNLTYAQRKAMSFVIKQQIDVAINRVSRLSVEYKWKVLCEHKRRAIERGLNDRRN